MQSVREYSSNHFLSFGHYCTKRACIPDKKEKQQEFLGKKGNSRNARDFEPGGVSTVNHGDRSEASALF
jgi:hypothetical protein